MPDVSHPKSLSTQFSPPAPINQGDNAQPGQINGQPVHLGPPQHPRATQALNAGQRFANRAKRFFGNLKAGLPQFGNRKDRIKSQKSDRFNARLVKFSDRVQSSVTQLAQTNGQIQNRSKSLETLHNDMNLLKGDHPQADKFDVMSARLDVELNQLTDAELTNFMTNVGRTYNDLSNRNLSGMRFGDQLEVLQLMLSAALRHQAARSTDVGTLIGRLNPDNPSNVDNRDNIKNETEALYNDLRTQLRDTCGLRGPELERHTEYALSKAIQIRLQRDNFNPTQVAGMNRNLLNVTQSFRNDLYVDGQPRPSTQSTEIYSISRPLRMLNRAVRETYLQSKVGNFRDENVTTRYKKIGQGAAHSVSKLNYRDVEPTKVYKADDETIIHDEYNRPDFHGDGRYCAPKLIGIDQSSPRLLERAVVTSKFANELGWDVAAQTDYASHNGQLGIIQDLAPGKVASTSGLVKKAVQANKASFQKQMAQLHLLDVITAQGDRHRSNYMISVNGDQVKVTGIDSDFCMGPKAGDPRSLIDVNSSHMPGLPNVVDQDMFDQVMGLDEAKIRQLCGDDFSDVTIQATIDRVTALQTHLLQLQTDGKVIDPDDWGTVETDALLANEAGRDAALNQLGVDLDASIPNLRNDHTAKLLAARDVAQRHGILDEFNRFLDRRGSKSYFEFARSSSYKRLGNDQRNEMEQALFDLQISHNTVARAERKRRHVTMFQEAIQQRQERIAQLQPRLTEQLSRRQKQRIETEIGIQKSELQDLTLEMHDDLGIEINGYYSREMLKERPEGMTFLDNLYGY
ncbi:hypothetical protein GC197_09050 [bacterium]|nr:hypothetical protein [bacterium]